MEDPPPRIAALRAFYGRPFRLFWAGALLSFGAMQMQQLARGFLARELTESPLLVTSVFALGMLPMLLMPFVGGILADRSDKRSLLLALEVGQIAVALGMGLLMATGAFNMTTLMALSFVAGILMGLSVPIRQSTIPQIAEPNTQTNALILYSTIFSLMMIAAPAIGGGLIDVAGAESPFYVSCGFSLLSMWFLARMPSMPPVANRRTEPVVKELTEGFQAVRASRPLGLVMLSGFVGTVLLIPHVSLFPIYQRDILEVGPSGLGLMFAASGVGALLVALVIAITSSERPSPRLSLFMGALAGLTIAVFSQSSSFVLSLIILVAVGAFSQGFFTLNMALVQMFAPSHVMGRVIALRVVIFGMAPGGQVLLGVGANLTSPETALGIMGLLAFIPQIVMIWRPRMPGLTTLQIQQQKKG